MAKSPCKYKCQEPALFDCQVTGLSFFPVFAKPNFSKCTLYIILHHEHQAHSISKPNEANPRPTPIYVPSVNAPSPAESTQPSFVHLIAYPSLSSLGPTAHYIPSKPPSVPSSSVPATPQPHNPTALSAPPHLMPHQIPVSASNHATLPPWAGYVVHRRLGFAIRDPADVECRRRGRGRGGWR